MVSDEILKFNWYGVLKFNWYGVLKFNWYGVLKFNWYVVLKLVNSKIKLKIVTMAIRFWKSMPAALNMPTLDKLYKRLRNLDDTQVDEKLAVMLNTILQLEAQGECRESATGADGRLHHGGDIQPGAT